MMGLAFKPDIDDLRESPAKYIVTKVIQKFNNADILIVEPNLKNIRFSSCRITRRHTVGLIL